MYWWQKSSNAWLAAAVALVIGMAVVVSVNTPKPSTPPPTMTTLPTTTTTLPEAPLPLDCSAGPVIPPKHAIGMDVSKLPADPQSVEWATAMGAAVNQASAGGQAIGPNLKILNNRTVSGPNSGPDRYPGVPLNLIAKNPPLAFFDHYWAGLSNTNYAPYPIPLRQLGYGQKLQTRPGGPLWSWQGVGSNGNDTPLYDGILLSVTADCTYYDTTNWRPNPWFILSGSFAVSQFSDSGSWKFGPNLEPGGVNSTNVHGASGMPLGATNLTAAEVEAKVIKHSFHFFTATARGGKNAPNEGWVWPARNTDAFSDVPDPGKPPYGAIMRLRADYPIDGLDPRTVAVIRAMQTYGNVLADGGAQGIMSEDFSQTVVDQLEKIPYSAFDYVDLKAQEAMRANPTASVNAPDYWTTK